MKTYQQKLVAYLQITKEKHITYYLITVAHNYCSSSLACNIDLCAHIALGAEQYFVSEVIFRRNIVLRLILYQLIVLIHREKAGGF